MSKIDCGSLARAGKDGVELRGPVQLGQRLDGVLCLRKHVRAGVTDDHPDYAVEYTPHGGRPRPAGAGWIKNNDRAGDFISMTIDDPDWSGPVNLTAFPIASGPGTGNWVVVWSRPRGVRTQDADTNSNSERGASNTPSL